MCASRLEINAMKNAKLSVPVPRPLVFMVLLAVAATASRAGTMSASTNAPAITSSDIANYAAVTGNEKWWAEDSAAGAAKGQTFSTSNSPVLLKAITYQTSSKAEPTKVYTVRVGTVSGSSFSQVYAESFTQSFTWNGGEYMTWRFSTSVVLQANTTYGIDVGMRSSSSAWQTGIPYINVTANAYAGGQRYSSGTSGVGTSNITLVATSDRTFHLDLDDPLQPLPEDGSSMPAGPVQLSWRNLTPSVGSDVWVDVWFGTNSGALAQVVSG
jgi:hypothetical protein